MTPWIQLYQPSHKYKVTFCILWVILTAGLVASLPRKMNTFRRRVKNVVSNRGIQVWVEFEVKWCEVNWSDICEVTSFLKWSGVRLKFLGTEVPSTLRWTYTEGIWLYCDYFIWCVSCTVVVLTGFVMCGCVYVWVLYCVGVCMCACVCVCVRVCVCVCAGFVLCGCVHVWVL